MNDNLHQLRCFGCGSRISGAEASPQPGGLLDIKKLKLEEFGVDGKLEAVAEAPECVYDSMNGLANSPDHLQMKTGDGNLSVEGEGFLWRQDDNLLIISNQAQTVIEPGSGTGPNTKMIP